MNVKQLRELLEGHKDETEIKLGGWVESIYTTRYSYNQTPLAEKHFNFEKNSEDKLTITIEVDV